MSSSEICISTQGKDNDALVTHGGITVNSKNAELGKHFLDAGLPIIDKNELKEKTEKITGKPKKVAHGDRIVAEVINRDGFLLDNIYSVPKKN